MFARENPAWRELEPHLCYCWETLCDSLSNSPLHPQICQPPLHHLLQVPPCQLPHPGKDMDEESPLPGGQRGPAMAGRAALMWETICPAFISAQPQPQMYKTACQEKNHQLRLRRGELNTPGVIATYAQRYNPDFLLALAPFFFFFFF